MSRIIVRRIHAAASATAFLTILGFWTGSLAVELFGGTDAIADVKRAILWGLAVLVPAMAIATGMRLGGKAVRGPAVAKKRRMPFIAANGLLVLVPCAIVLDRLASAGTFGTLFTAVQVLELAAGAVNIVLMGAMLRDGLTLTGRIRPAPTPGRSQPSA